MCALTTKQRGEKAPAICTARNSTDPHSRPSHQVTSRSGHRLMISHAIDDTLLQAHPRSHLVAPSRTGVSINTHRHSRPRQTRNGHHSHLRGCRRNCCHRRNCRRNCLPHRCGAGGNRGRCDPPVLKKPPA
jgi:hypothetical protein